MLLVFVPGGLIRILTCVSPICSSRCVHPWKYFQKCIYWWWCRNVLQSRPHFSLFSYFRPLKTKKKKRHRQRQIWIASYPTYDIFSNALASLAALMVVSHSHKLFPVPQLVNIYFPVPQHPVSAHRLIFSFYRWYAIKQNVEKACFTAAKEKAIVQQMKMARLRLFMLVVVRRI